MAAPEGAPRFECPADFCPCPFSPGPAFSQETLQSPSKQLWLIQAPANFCPESLDGHVVPLLGAQMLQVSQPGGTQKVYGFQASPGDLDSAHLLIPSGHRGHLTCAPSFSGMLSICERYGDPSANQLLFPVAARQAPQIPGGLRQRFLPFGGRPKSPSLQEVAEGPPRRRRRKKKKHQLYTGGYMGAPEELLPPKHEPCPGGASAVPAGDSMALSEAGSGWDGERSQRPKKGQREVLPVAGTVQQPLPEQGPQSSSHLEGSSQESLPSGGVMDPSHRSKKKKKQQQQQLKEEEEEAPLEPSSLALQPWFQGNPEASVPPEAEGLVHCKPKKRRRQREEEAAAAAQAVMGVLSVKEAERGQWDFGDPGATLEGSLGESVPSGRHKKRKKEKVVAVEAPPWAQGAGAALLEPSPVKPDWGELGPLCGEGPGQDEPLLPGVEGTSPKHKKKKKKPKREAAEEESWAS